MTPRRVLFLHDGCPQREAILAQLAGLDVQEDEAVAGSALVVAALGGTIGLQLLERLTAPVILLADPGSAAEGLEAIRRGACDYLPLAQLERLGPLVRAGPPPGYLCRQALESLPVGVAVLDGAGRVTAANGTWIGPAVGASYLAEDVTVGEVLEGTREGYVREYSAPGPTGEPCWYEVRAMPIQGYAGALLTQREFWSWGSEAILSQLGDALQQCFWLSSPSNEVLYLSPGYESITGLGRERAYSAEERLQLVHVDDRERFAAARPSLATGHYDLEYRIVRPDGEIRWLHSRGFPVRDEQGRVIRVAGILEDVTERHPPAPATVRVGIAEDEPAIRSLVARVLRRRGFDARELDLHDEELEEFDVLITDVFLPGLTGVDLATRLTERFPQLKVIYMSGYTPEALAALGLAPTPLLLKPFAPDDLMHALDRALGRYI